MLGGAPSMFLCLEDVAPASFMFHLCPRGSNEADSMYLRHRNRDYVFLKNIMSYFGKYTIPPPNRAFFEYWKSAVRPFWRRSIKKNLTPCFLYYLGVADNLGKTVLSCLLLNGEIERIRKCKKGGYWKFIQSGIEENLGNCVCIVDFAPDLGKPAFLILRNENMRVPWPGDCAENSKLKNVGFWLSPHFAVFLYINSRYTAMAAWYYIIRCGIAHGSPLRDDTN